MDGRRVFKRGGPSWFGLRRKHHDWEVWGTDDGVEFKRDGRSCWGIKV